MEKLFYMMTFAAILASAALESMMDDAAEATETASPTLH